MVPNFCDSRPEKIDREEALEEVVRNLEGPGLHPRRCVTAIAIGCGSRGQVYTSYALDFPRRLKIVGVADPMQHRTLRMRQLHNIDDDMMVSDNWRHFANMDKKVADFAIIATPDKHHKDPAVALAKLGELKTSFSMK